MSDQLVGFRVAIFTGRDPDGKKVWCAALDAPPRDPVFGDVRYSQAEADADATAMLARIKAKLASIGAPLYSHPAQARCSE